MRLIAATAVLALAGCATYSEVQTRAPLIEYTSARPQAEVVECLSTVLLDRYQVTTLPLPDGVRLVAKMGNDDQTISTTAILSTAAGTRVEYRQLNDMTGAGWRNVHAQIRACE